jgi:hypothetical protein
MAAERGPAYITDRGRPAHVLLTFDAYEELVGPHRALDVLAEPAGVADVEFETTKSTDAARLFAFAITIHELENFQRFEGLDVLNR